MYGSQLMVSLNVQVQSTYDVTCLMDQLDLTCPTWIDVVLHHLLALMYGQAKEMSCLLFFLV